MSQTIDTIIDKKAYEQVEMLRDDVQGLYMDLLKIMEMGKSGFKMDTSSIKLPADLKEFMAQHTQYAQKQEKQIESLEKKVLKLKEARSSYTKNLSWEEKAERKLQLAKDRVKESESELGKAIVRTRNEANANNRVSKQTATLYGRVSAKLKETSNEYYELALKKQLTGKATEEEIRRMSLLESRMDKYSDSLMTVEKRSGNYHRNVGNYKSGFDGLAMSMAQLTREGPAFAYSMQTGFLAISNNLPILVDEINKVRMANKALAAEGKTTQSVLSKVGAAIFSWQTALSLAITLLTIYGQDLIEAATGLSAMEKAQQELNKTMDQAASDAKNASLETRTYREIVEDTNNTEEERAAALNKIKSEIPQLEKVTLDLLDANDGVNDANKLFVSMTDKVVAATEARAKANALANIIAEQERNIIEAKNKPLADNVKWYEQLWNGVKNVGNVAGMAMDNTMDAVRNQNEELEAQQNILDEINKLYKEQIKLAIVGEDDIEKDKGPKKKKEKDYGPEDFYNLQKARLERAIETEKEITENTEEQLALRLQANFNLLDAEQKLQDLETAWATTNAKDRADKLKQIKEEYLANSTQLSEDYSDREKKILETNFAYQMEQFKKLQEADELRLQQEINTLTASMIEKGATYEQIEKEVEKVRKDSLRRQLNAQIDEAEKELLIVAQTEEEKAEVYKKIAELREELNDINMPDKTGKSEGFFSDEEIESLRLVQDLIGGISDLFAAFSARRIQQIEEEMEANDRLYEQVKNSEESTEQQKEEARKEREEKDKKLRKEIAKEKEKQARIDKAAAIAEIAINTAIAISKTTAEAGIFGIPLIPIIAAIGAVQIATVLAQPIPKFKEGHLSGTYEGWAMINDSPSANYREILEQADGTLYSPEERNQKVYMKRGDKVHKSHDSFLETKGYKEIMDATVMASLMNHNMMATEKEISDEFESRLIHAIGFGIKEGFESVELKGQKSTNKAFDYDRLADAFKKSDYFNK